MAMLTTSLQAGRVGILKYEAIQSQKFSEWKKLFNEVSTTQDFEIIRQMTDYGYPQATDEGAPAVADSRALLYEARYTPIEYVMLFGMTHKANFTAQYANTKMAAMKDDIVNSFLDLRSLTAANVLNNGFTTNGIDGSPLFATSHSYGAYGTWGNRPTTDLAFSALALEAASQQIRAVKTVRGRPMRLRSGKRVTVPTGLEFQARHVINSTKQAGTNSNDSNELSNVDLFVWEDLSSQLAWFVGSADAKQTGLFWLQQMPFTTLGDDKADTRTRTYYTSFFESFLASWSKAQGMWGTLGQ
jgi:hypothetical protein